MKKNLALLLTLLAVLSSARLAHGQPHVIDLTYPDNVNLFDLYEVSFNLDSIYSNPYDPESISVSAEFVSTAHGTIVVNGFYYECYTLFYDEG